MVGFELSSMPDPTVHVYSKTANVPNIAFSLPIKAIKSWVMGVDQSQNQPTPKPNMQRPTIAASKFHNSTE